MMVVRLVRTGGALPPVLPLPGSGANTEVTASGHVGDVEVAAGNRRVTAPSADDVTLSAGTAAAVFSGPVGRVELLEGNTSVRAEVADRVLVTTANASFKADRAAVVTVRGANDAVRLVRLPRLKVVGPNNLAVVKKGSTKVTVRGANNRIRVNKRA